MLFGEVLKSLQFIKRHIALDGNVLIEWLLVESIVNEANITIVMGVENAQWLGSSKNFFRVLIEGVHVMGEAHDLLLGKELWTLDPLFDVCVTERSLLRSLLRSTSCSE